MQYIPHLWKSSRFDRYAILLSVALVWAYAAVLTGAGAYNNKSPNTQFSCRVDRSGLIGGASWYGNILLVSLSRSISCSQHLM